MRVYDHPIVPALQGFVQCIMVIDARTPSGTDAAPCLYPPTPQNSLFFYLEDQIRVSAAGTDQFEEQPRAVMVGPQAFSVSIDVRQHHKAVRIGFEPAGLFRLVKMPLHNWVDKSCDTSLLLGREITELTEQMQEAEGLVEIALLAEGYLLRKLLSLTASIPVDYALHALIQSQGRITVDELASMACLSNRQLERQCRQRMGFSPKFFARLTRFSHAYRIRESDPLLSWTSIAHESGYFDQMHLIRDFKTFTGKVPRLLQQELERAPLLLQSPLKI